MESTCPLCQRAPQAIAENDLAVAIRDNFPISSGHTLVIPRRHFARLEDAASDEMVAIFNLVRDVTSLIENDPPPDVFNIGVNDGVAAGQTVHQ